MRRATEIQTSAGPGPSRGGLTLPELEDIATEVGIEVEVLRQAADELDAGPPPSRASRAFFGAPLRILRERRLPFEADAGRFDQLIPIIQSGIDRNGNPARSAGRSPGRTAMRRARAAAR